jgi:hypothetical protein
MTLGLTRPCGAVCRLKSAFHSQRLGKTYFEKLRGYDVIHSTWAFGSVVLG